MIAFPALLIAQMGWTNDAPARFRHKRARNAVMILAVFVLFVCAHVVAVEIETPDPDPRLTNFDMPEEPPPGWTGAAEPAPTPPRPPATAR